MIVMPYSDDVLFKKILRVSLGFYVLAGLIVALIRLPVPEHPDIQDLPERVAKLILEPPPVIATPEVPKAAEPAKEKEAAKPKAEKKPEPAPAPKPSAQQTREIVKQSGLLASLIEEEERGGLSDIIENQRLDQVLSSADLITTPTATTSRTLVTKPISRDTGLVDKTVAKSKTLGTGDRTTLAEGERVALARIPSGTGTGGAGQRLGEGVGIRVKGGSGSGTAAIDYDSIARVVEQYKSGLIYLYNKELRSNPTLKGTIAVEFSIDGSGKVVETRIISSTMGQSSLEQALASRIKMWKFPHLYDGIIIVTYPFVFFPV
ncbi:MAG: AgmX/PglI C-terminal domain-containing protein [Nitrospirae bacterium]|nr:AgmX/PglI C-terminal domain-containing protein [Nitrospirota bacterium]